MNVPTLHSSKRSVSVRQDVADNRDQQEKFPHCAYRKKEHHCSIKRQLQGLSCNRHYNITSQNVASGNGSIRRITLVGTDTLPGIIKTSNAVKISCHQICGIAKNSSHSQHISDFTSPNTRKPQLSRLNLGTSHMLLELEIFSLTPVRAVFVFAHQLLAVL